MLRVAHPYQLKKKSPLKRHRSQYGDVKYDETDIASCIKESEGKRVVVHLNGSDGHYLAIGQSTSVWVHAAESGKQCEAADKESKAEHRQSSDRSKVEKV